MGRVVPAQIRSGDNHRDYQGRRDRRDSRANVTAGGGYVTGRLAAQPCRARPHAGAEASLAQFAQRLTDHDSRVGGLARATAAA